MTNGTNWMGGRGKKAKSGLKILERGGNPEQYFARLRAVASNLVVPDRPSRDTNSTATPFVSLKHAQLDPRGPMSMSVHEATGTEDDLIQSNTSTLPRVIDKPNKPTKQNRLPELVDTAVRNIESLDAKRAYINAIDAKSLAGLDIASRKRKYEMVLDGQVTSKPFYYPPTAKPRTFVASPSPGPPIIVDTCTEQAEDMLSFGSPSDKLSVSGTQPSTIRSSGQVRDEQTADQTQTAADAPPVSTIPAKPQSSTKEIDIPPTLYEDAFRAAAQTLKLQDALLGVQTNITLAPWRTSPSENDSDIRTFNLFMPTEVDTLDGMSPDSEPRMTVIFQGEHSAMDEENRLDIGHQARNSSTQDAENNKASDLPTKPHGKPRMETPIGTKPPPPPTKPTRKSRSNSGKKSMAPSALDIYVLRSHPSHSRTSNQVNLSSDHSNVHGKTGHREPIVTTQSAARMDIALDFASAESSPSPSQGIEASLTTGNGNNRTIGLQLFDDHPQMNVEADA